MPLAVRARPSKPSFKRADLQPTQASPGLPSFCAASTRLAGRRVAGQLGHEERHTHCQGGRMAILPTEIEIEPQPFAIARPQLPASRRCAQGLFVSVLKLLGT